MLLAVVSLEAAGVLAMLLQGRSGTPSMAVPKDALLLRLVRADKRLAVSGLPTSCGVQNAAWAGAQVAVCGSCVCTGGMARLNARLVTVLPDPACS